MEKEIKDKLGRPHRVVVMTQNEYESLWKTLSERVCNAFDSDNGFPSLGQAIAAIKRQQKYWPDTDGAYLVYGTDRFNVIFLPKALR